MERKNFRPDESRPALEVADCGLNLTRARQETQNVSGRGGCRLLRRVRYGPLKLDVEPGKFRELTSGEVEKLKSAAEGSKEGM